MNGDMTIKKVEKKLCPCCMEVHDVQTISGRESNVLKGIPVEYDVEYYYCDQADETYADEQQLFANHAAVKMLIRRKWSNKGQRRKEPVERPLTSR